MRNCEQFAPIPFWFLNDDFDKEEILRQLDIMQKCRIGGFFMHVRDGILEQAYGTECFFENIRFIVEEAAKRDLKAWLYDEDSYPSGNVGGQVVIDRPELQAKALVVKKLSPEEINGGIARRVLGRVKGLYGYALINKDGQEKAIRLENCFGAVRRRWYRMDMTKAYYCDMSDIYNPHIRAATSYTEIMFEAKVPEDAEVYVAYLVPIKTDSRYGTQINCLHKDAVKEFISRVHEKYARYVGEYFGNTVPGIFLDEPSVGGDIDEEFLSCFKQLHGYALEDQLYKLCVEYTGDYAKLRRDYAFTSAEMFRNNFIKPLHEWCKEHNLLFTGHFAGEEDPLGCARGGHSVYRNVKEMDVPGFDIISNNLGNNAHPALVLGSRLVVSSAAQEGKNKVLAECFALNPFNFGYEGLKKVGDWLFACGINFLVPHAFHYGYCAYQRTDAGKSFFFQDTQFDEYLKFSRYAAKVCEKMSAYESANDVLVVLPDGAFGEEIIYPVTNTYAAPTKRGLALRESCAELVRYFSSNQIGWDITDTKGALEGVVENGKLTIGKLSYSSIVVVEGGVQEEKAFTRLKTAGLNVTRFNGKNKEVLPIGSRWLGKTENLLALRKTHGEKQIFFLFQNGKEGGSIRIPIGEQKAFIYDAEQDKTFLVKTKDGFAEVYLKGFGSTILLVSKTMEKVDGEYQAKAIPDTVLDYEIAPQWTYLPYGARSAITTYDIVVDKEGERTEYAAHKFTRLRDILGTQDEIYQDNFVIPYFDCAKRPEKLYPVKAIFTAKIEMASEKDYILFDGGAIEGTAEIFWNGKKIENSQIQKRRVYDIKNFAFTPEWKKGENILELRYLKADEFDGVGGEIYIMKTEKEDNA